MFVSSVFCIFLSFLFFSLSLSLMFREPHFPRNSFSVSMVPPSELNIQHIFEEPLSSQLINNPKYGGLNTHVAHAQVYKSMFKQLHSDRCGPIIRVETLQKASTVAERALKIIAVTYAVYSITKKIIFLKEEKEIAVAAEEFEKQLEAKGYSIPEAVSEKIAELKGKYALK